MKKINKINFIIIGILVILALVLFFRPFGLVVVPTNGLIGEWNLDGNAEDSTDNTDGTIFNCNLTQDRFGNSNSAYSFNGVNSYIDLGYNPSILNLSKYTGLTISAWIKIPSNQRVGGGTIFAKRGLGTSYSYQFRISNNVLNFLTSGGAVSGTSTISYNIWHHVAVVRNSTNTTLYLDGNPQIRTSTPFRDYDTNVYIGYDYQANYFNGSIDNVRVYNRPLTNLEVLNLANEQNKVRTGKDLLLSGEWEFDGNTDDSVGNNKGILSGATLTQDRFGKSNSAYFFDGVNDYIQIPHSESINFHSNNSYSVSVWFRNWGKTKDQSILEKWSLGTGSYPYVIRGPLSSNAYISVAIYDSINKLGPTGGIGPNSNDSKWHNVVLVKDYKKNTVYLYYDGELSRTLPDNTISDVSNDNDLIVGARHPGTKPDNKNFFGDIDDLRIYSGPLTESDVKDIYNEPNPNQNKVLKGSRKLDRVCYMRSINNCNAEIRTVEEPCDFITLDTCLNSNEIPRVTSVTYFDKDGNKIVQPLSILSINKEYAKVYEPITNNNQFNIYCTISSQISFIESEKVLTPGQTSLFESELLDYSNRNIEVSIDCYGNDIKLPTKTEVIKI